MQKKLIALAIAGAFVAPAAFAESGNVTIYGVMDASYDLVKNGEVKGQAAGTAVTGTSTNRVSGNSSRLGFKGTEDLGNGLAAVWQIESLINPDTGSNTLASRNTFVGLSGKTWGTVILGRHDTPYKLATRDLDMFGDGTADNRNIMGAGAVLNSSTTVNGANTRTTVAAGFSGGAFDGRQNNVIAYISPTFNGFHGAIAYVAGSESATTSGAQKGSAWSATGVYSNGPWFGSLAYESQTVGNVGALGIQNTAFAPTTTAEQHAWKLGLGYKANAFRVGFSYEHTADDMGKAGFLSAAGSARNDLFGHNAWNLGGGYTFGNNEVKLQYTKAGDFNQAASTGARQWALGLDHNFSKRTKIYAQYVSLKNDDNANYFLGVANGNTVTAATDGSANVTGGASQDAWSFGVRHTF